MKRLFLALLAVAALVTASPTSFAGTASTSLNVSVTVDNSCVISTGSVTFPIYNALGTNSTVPDDGSGSVIIRCSTGTVAHIGLGGGSNYSSNSNHMVDGSSNLLPYALYQNSSRNVAWGNTSADWLTTPAAPDTNQQVYTVYGRIPPGQTVPGGNYSDTVVASVNF